MNEETLSKLSEVLCKAFHIQQWTSVDDDGEGSEINRIAWKVVIEAYEIKQ
jgi:hypothetical protein